MEHTDAGAYVGLADTCLPEYAFADDGDMPPATTCPVPPEAALPPPPGSRRHDEVPGGGVTHGDVAHESASSSPDREPAVRLADIVDIGLASLFPEPMEWQERALCAQTDPEAFFPEKGGSTREAKRICSGCEVRPQCLEYALANDERFGIWGGMSERERRKQRRRAV